MHKVLVDFGSNEVKKILKCKNIYSKIANNHKIQNHKFSVINHIVSKEWIRGFLEMAPIYDELNYDYGLIDFVDLKFYERWLND